MTTTVHEAVLGFLEGAGPDLQLLPGPPGVPGPGRVTSPDAFTKAQRRAIFAPHSVAISAGAGRCKTRVLAKRVLHLLTQEVAPSRIVAVTAHLTCYETHRKMLCGRGAAQPRCSALDKIPSADIRSCYLV